MDRFMPATGIDCSIAALLIDTEAPLDVLHETAAYCIRTATQLLESFAANENVHSNWRGCWSLHCATAAICWTSSGDDCRRRF
jgi:hypothetical protein